MPKAPKSDVRAERARLMLSDCREAIHWFGSHVLTHEGSHRGLLASDFAEEHDAVLESALIGVKGRGITPLVLTGETIYKQGDYLWDVALKESTFGRPVAGKLELEANGADVLIIKDLEAPESARQLWYLYHYVLFPRALANKPTMIATPLSYEEFVMYGAGCEDAEYGGRKISWEKVLWVLNSTAVDLHQFKQLNSEELPAMVMPEYALFKTLMSRGLVVSPHYVVGNAKLDLAIIDKDNKLNIECDLVHMLDSPNGMSKQSKRNQELIRQGWKILRFSANEILGNIGGCAEAVEEVWTQGRKKSFVGRLLTAQDVRSMPALPSDDEGQLQAVMHPGGPAAVSGGAGTGKTTCLLHRAAYLIASGANPEQIVILGFSPESNRNLKDGLEKIVDKQTAQKVNVFTWDELGLRILKENLGAIKRKPPLKIESNPQKIIQRLLAKYKKELDPATLELSEELDELTVLSLISLYKANLVTPKYVKERCQSQIDELVAKVYIAYEEHLQRSNRIDRDDMVSQAAQLLADQPEIRTRYQYQYEYVLVDEYQDATAAGDLLARLLAFPEDGVFVVGDEDESVNENRGGLPRLIADISVRLPNARCYLLEQNWRCHPQIVEHAQELAAHLTRRKFAKNVRSAWALPATAAIMGPISLEDEHAEAERIADEIELLIESGRKPSEIAVLYRYQRFALIIEEALSRRGVRCLASHSDTGLVPDEIGDVMAFLKLVMDPDGPKAREAFERICQLRVKEVDPKLSATIASFAEQNNLSYLKAVEIYAEAVPELPCRELADLVKLIRTLNQEKMPPGETIAVLMRSKTLRLKEFYSAIKVPTGVNYEPLRAVHRLQDEARDCKSVTEFVKNFFASRQSTDDEESPSAAVNVLSLHEAKGREFLIVFVVGLAEGLFPPAGESSDREEERRLCYVGMTRARELLYLSYPQRFNGVALAPSSFLTEARLLSPRPVPIKSPVSEPVSTATTSPPQAVAPATLPAAPNQAAPPVAKPASSSVPVAPVAKPASSPVPVPPVAKPAGPHVPVSPVPAPTAPAVAPPVSKQVTPLVPPPAPVAAPSPATNKQVKASPSPSVVPVQIMPVGALSPPNSIPEAVPPRQSSRSKVEPWVESPAPIVEPTASAPIAPMSELSIAPPPQPVRPASALTSPGKLGTLPGEEVPGETREGAAVPWSENSSVVSALIQAAVEEGLNGEDVARALATVVQCQACGGNVERGCNFCGECGEAVQAVATIPSCHLCGAALDEDASFCGECGSKRVQALPPVRKEIPQPQVAPQGSATALRAAESALASRAQSQAQTQPTTQKGWVVKLLKSLE